MSLAIARVFDTSVGTKILIGVTGLALFLYLIIHIAGNLMVFLGPDVFNEYAHTLDRAIRCSRSIEIGLLLVFLVHIYKTVRMFLANRQARPVALRAEEARRAAEPQDARLVDDDRLGALAAASSSSSTCRTFRFGAEYETAGRRARSLSRSRWRTSRNPLTVAFYVLSMVVVGSHLWHGVVERASSRSASTIRAGRRGILAAGKVLAVVIAGGFIVIALWAHFVGARP